MALTINPLSQDAGLDVIANSTQLNICSIQPLTYYEAVDPPVWVSSTAYALGDAVRATTRNGFAQECTTAGTSGGSEPSWNTTPGQTTTDGTVTWTCRNNYSLMTGALSAGDFTKANGDVSGRKLTTGAKSAMPIHTTGVSSHAAETEDATKQLWLVTETDAQPLTSGTGGTGSTNAFNYEVRDPT